jgi:HlyD family secretion protein
LLAQKGTKGYPFKPGMTASVEIITDRKSGVLAVPIAAVTTRGAETEVPENTDRPSGTVDEKPAQQTEKKEKVKRLCLSTWGGRLFNVK